MTAEERSEEEENPQQETIEIPQAYLSVTWEPQVAQRIIENIEAAGESTSPYMVSLIGIPGSGKTVSSFLIADILEQHGLPTMIMPHDGYHYPLQVLETFPDPKDAIYRRGAPDTFDPLLLARDLTRIKTGEETVIMLPAFHHEKGDPEPNKHVFDRNRHKVVLCEGLYLLHDEDGWESVPGIFDLSIFMNADVETCLERLKIRNQCIPGYTPEEIALRVEEVDRVNTEIVLRSRVRADIVVDKHENEKRENETTST